MSFIKTSIISLIIRSVGMLSRLILLIFIAKYLPTREYGIYGLIQSSLAIGIYLIGLDVYAFTNREIAKRDIKGAQTIIQSQCAVYLVAYLFFFPLILFVLSNNFIPSEYIIWFCTLLILEHIALEIVRTLMALQHPLYANILISFSSVLWIACFLLISFIYPYMLSIKSMIIFWVCGLSGALIIGIGFLMKIKILPFESWKIDNTFIKTAIKGSSIFLMSSICYKTIEFSDRYFLKYYYSTFEVGIYSFFQSIANLTSLFIYTGVVMLILPKLIEAKSKQNVFVYKKMLVEMHSGIFYGTILLSIFLFFIVDPFLVFIGKTEMLDNKLIFMLLLLGSIILNLSLVGHYTLYIYNKDKKILTASFSGALVNTALNIILIPSFGLWGAVCSTVISILVMGGTKFYFAQKIEPIKYGAIFCSPWEFVKSLRVNNKKKRYSQMT